MNALRWGRVVVSAVEQTVLVTSHGARGWKNHDSFEKAFTQLLEGLKAVDAPPAPRIEPKAKPKNMPQEPEKIIARKKRRLEVLEEQAAIKGISTPPEVVTEIEDLRREIGELEA